MTAAGIRRYFFQYYYPHTELQLHTDEILEVACLAGTLLVNMQKGVL